MRVGLSNKLLVTLVYALKTLKSSMNNKNSCHLS